MITVYDVIDTGDCIATYLYKDKAKRHTSHARQFCRGNESVEVVFRKTEKIARQRVHIDGNDIGFQFASRKMGSTSVTRTVYSLERRMGIVFGKIQWYGMTVDVRHYTNYAPRARSDSQAKWESIR